jgi:hypothetical protein
LAVWVLGAWAAACGALSLNDVVPYADAAEAGRPLGEAGPDRYVPCDAGGDPCACLPTPTVVSSGMGKIEAFAIDSTYAYVAAGLTMDNPAVYSLPLAGPDAGPTTELVATYSLGSASDFAVDPLGVYVCNGNTRPVLRRIPLDAGTLDSLTPVLTSLALDVQVTPSGIYWTNSDSAICVAGLGGSTGPGDSGCGGDQLLAPLTPDASSFSNQIAVDDAGVYLAIERTGQIVRVPFAGGVTLVADGGTNSFKPTNGTANLAVSGGQLFWTSPRSDGGAIVAAAAATGNNPTAIAYPSAVQAFAVDATNVYYIDGAGMDRRIYGVPKAGGASPTLLVCDSEAPQFIAVGATRIYWADVGNEGVYSLPK